MLPWNAALRWPFWINITIAHRAQVSSIGQTEIRLAVQGGVPTKRSTDVNQCRQEYCQGSLGKQRENQHHFVPGTGLCTSVKVSLPMFFPYRYSQLPSQGTRPSHSRLRKGNDRHHSDNLLKLQPMRSAQMLLTLGQGPSGLTADYRYDNSVQSTVAHLIPESRTGLQAAFNSTSSAECRGMGSGCPASTLCPLMPWNHPFLQGNSLRAVGKCATERA